MKREYGAQYGCGYDKADNRTEERIDDEVTTADFNNVNQLTETSGGGLVRFSGLTDEEAAVTVDGQDAHTWDGGTKFSKDIALSPGSHTITVTAEDPSGNLAAQGYDVDISGGTAQSFTYDANGNMTSDGVRGYEWDAENRLIKIIEGTLTTAIEYDGLHRWTRILEKDGTATLSDRRFIWSGTELLEQRNGTSTSTAQRYFPQGVRQGSTSYYYTRDHLGSIREVTNGSGTVVARYDYDPYGRRTKLSGSFNSDFGFTGHYFHQQSGLHFAPYRAYSADLGRWLSRDPIGERGGINLYGYVSNNPIFYRDPLGLIVEMRCTRCKENPSGPMDCQLFKDGKPYGKPFKTNENGYNPNSKGPIPPGDYDLQPKPSGQMDPGNEDLSGNVENGKVNGEYPVGTPSITGKGHAPGSIDGRSNLRVHNPGAPGIPDSDGCITTGKCGDIQREMEKQDGHLPLNISEIDCCK